MLHHDGAGSRGAESRFAADLRGTMPALAGLSKYSFLNKLIVEWGRHAYAGKAAAKAILHTS